MRDDEDFLTVRERASAAARAEVEQAAVEAAEAVAAVEEAESDPAQRQEWIKQTNLSYGGLMAAALVMVQPFLTAPLTDTSSKVSVIAFAIAVPMLAALLMVNRQEAFRKQTSPSRLVQFGRVVAQGSGFAGIAAAFWHISWIAGVVLIVGAVVAVGVHSAGYVRLEYDARRHRRYPPNAGSPTTGAQGSARDSGG